MLRLEPEITTIGLELGLGLGFSRTKSILLREKNDLKRD